MSGVVATSESPTDYERRVWREVVEWRRDEGLEPAAGDAERERTPSRGVRRRIGEAAAGRLAGAIHDLAQLRVESGVRRRLEAAASGGLEASDAAVAGIRRRYVAGMAAQGTVAGFFGFAGAAVDLPVVTVSLLRAVAEYGIAYGFDLTRVEERLWAAQLLALAAATDRAGRREALRNLDTLAEGSGSRLSLPSMDRATRSVVVRQVSRAITRSLAKRGLGRLLPVVGAVVAGYGDARLANEACEAAQQLYRERWLTARYPADALA